ncbi:MAG: PAS domain-containing protein, partial [Synergistaceae bacterium]|nr:PAS domain-containing protein [Synergistaceae bacterium]
MKSALPPDFSGEKFAEYLDLANIISWDWDMLGDYIVHNERWAELVGYTPEESCHTLEYWKSLVLPDDLPGAMEQIKKHISGESAFYESEYRLVHKDGHLIWCYDKGKIIEYDENDKPLRMVGVVQDLSNLKNAEKDLKLNLERVDVAVNIAEFGTFECKFPENLIRYSKEYFKMLGYSENELPNPFPLKRWEEELIHPDDLNNTVSVLNKHLKGETLSYECEERLKHKDGHYIWAKAFGRVVEFSGSGRPKRLIGGHLNINDLKTALEVNEKNRMSLENEIQSRTDDLVNQDKMLWKVHEIARNLLSYDESGSFDEIVLNSLRSIGEMMDQDSTYIYKDTRNENDELSCVKIYEWLKETDGAKDFTGLKSTSYARLPSIKDALDKKKCLNDFVENLSGSEKEIVESLGIKALLVAPIIIDNERWGFIGVDNYKSKKLFSELEENMLMMSGFLLASAIQKKINQAKMKEAEERTQIMLNTTPLCCSFWDGNYKPVYCNDETLRLFGLRDKQEYLSRFFELSPTYQPDGRSSSRLVFEYVEKAFKNGYCKFEWMHQKLDGEPIPTEVTLVRVKYKDENMLAGYTRDLRETKAMMEEINKAGEELRAARDEAIANSRTKSEFLAKMSHEIRTPLNAIIGMSELILREFLNPAVKEYATTIKQASVNLLSIINDILDLSKIESGKLEIIKEKYGFSSLINDVINIISMRLLDKPILFSVVIDSILPNNLIGDEVRVRQILLNLLSNAFKYTEKGRIALEIYSDFVNKDELKLLIDVTDTGIGIKEEDMKNLFGDYAKFDISRNKGVEGTGLGLAITRNLCEAMGGDIFVESTYGEGSSFRVVLPQTFYDYKEIALVSDPAKHSILLYEPREMYAKPILSSLDNLGVKFRLTAEQAEFAEALKGNGYSFIFLPSFLFYRTQDIIRETPDMHDGAPKLVVIADYGEVINEPDIITVSMPVYSVTIANTLNGAAQRSSYNDKASINVRFSAPSARILIVDDISTNLKVAKGLLSPYSMQIETCENGMEAVELVKSNNYDVVFMDHMMPVMDGIAA